MFPFCDNVITFRHSVIWNLPLLVSFVPSRNMIMWWRKKITRCPLHVTKDHVNIFICIEMARERNQGTKKNKHPVFISLQYISTMKISMSMRSKAVWKAIANYDIQPIAWKTGTQTSSSPNLENGDDILYLYGKFLGATHVDIYSSNIILSEKLMNKKSTTF